MEVKCATSFDERFDPNNVLNKYSTLIKVNLTNLVDLETQRSFG